MPKINYITTPIDKYVSRQKTGDMKYARTIITCPLCQIPHSKREFEEHVYKVHGPRADEAFAKLFGAPWPARCTCGKELHYSQANKGFPRTCGNCATGNVTGIEYHTSAEANLHVNQLKAMLAQAQEEAKRLAKEEELDKVPLNELPFPTRKDPRFIQRISKMMRNFAINGEKDELIKLANFIDGTIAKL